MDEFENEENPDPFTGCLTVRELIEKLALFDPALPIMGAFQGRVRENEYFDLAPQLSDLKDQNTDGDPMRWGTGTLVLLTN